MGADKIEAIAIGFVKELKQVENVNVVMKELTDGVWIVKGTCPIDLCGHPWRESFEIVIDKNGQIKDSKFQLM